MTLRNLCFMFFISGATVLESGCSADAPHTAGPDQTADERPPGEPAPVESSGQTGSILPSQCLQDVDCDVFAEQTLSELEQPLPVPPRFDRAECRLVGVAFGPDGEGGGSGPACNCHIAGTSESRELGPRFLETCTARGRLGECLAPASEFPGCSVATESAECQGLCDEFQAVLAADAARTFEAEVRSSHCVRDPNRTAIYYECQQIFEVDGGCFASFGPNAKRHDCSLSDEEILAEAAQAP